MLIQEGKHHQIRRMAKRSGFIVRSLCRTRIAGVLTLASVPVPGQCRWVQDEELEVLYTGLGITRSRSA